MIISVHQPQYIPWLGFFDKIKRSDCFVFLDLVQYKAREFQNRNKIRTKDGAMWLTVPVISKGLRTQKITDVLIDNESDWQNKHWGSIRSNYRRAPFFKRYESFFKETYSLKWEKLTELNVHIIKYILQELRINTPLRFESEIGTTCESTERIIELCRKLNADTYLSGIGGKDYLDEERFREENIKLEYQYYNHPVYRQVFGEPFVAHLSVIDLLFNHGEEAANFFGGKV